MEPLEASVSAICSVVLILGGPFVGLLLGSSEESFVNPKDGLTYVRLPPGRFTAGCSQGDSDCQSFEEQPHEVTIRSGFYIGKWPVTQDAYERVVGRNPSRTKGGQLPVTNVSWYDSQAYCRAISGRLPTNMEWEYAARAGSSGSRYGELNAVAWYSGNSGGIIHEVGQKQPNAFGLFDMLGNVWQWMDDADVDYSQAGSDRVGQADKPFRTLRGGSSLGPSRVVRVSFRNSNGPTFAAWDLGFRCVWVGQASDGMRRPAADSKDVPSAAVDTNRPNDAGRLLALVQNALGGKKRLVGIRDWKQRATEVWGPSQGTTELTTRFVAPSSIREESKGVNQTIDYSNGESGWTWSSSRLIVHDLPKGTAALMSFRVLNRLLLCDDDPTCTATLAAPDTLKLSDQNGNSVNLIIDLSTQFPRALVWQNADGAELAETYSDWRRVGNIMWWFHMRRARDGATFLEVRVRDYQINKRQLGN
jgi:formylglycine-generating enzyme required for sulfatase activity